MMMIIIQKWITSFFVIISLLLLITQVNNAQAQQSQQPPLPTDATGIWETYLDGFQNGDITKLIPIYAKGISITLSFVSKDLKAGSKTVFGRPGLSGFYTFLFDSLIAQAINVTNTVDASTMTMSNIFLDDEQSTTTPPPPVVVIQDISDDGYKIFSIMMAPKMGIHSIVNTMLLSDEIDKNTNTTTGKKEISEHTIFIYSDYKLEPDERRLSHHHYHRNRYLFSDPTGYETSVWTNQWTAFQSKDIDMIMTDYTESSILKHIDLSELPSPKIHTEVGINNIRSNVYDDENGGNIFALMKDSSCTNKWLETLAIANVIFGIWESSCNEIEVGSSTMFLDSNGKIDYASIAYVGPKPPTQSPTTMEEKGKIDDTTDTTSEGVDDQGTDEQEGKDDSSLSSPASFLFSVSFFVTTAVTITITTTLMS